MGMSRASSRSTSLRLWHLLVEILRCAIHDEHVPYAVKPSTIIVKIACTARSGKIKLMAISIDVAAQSLRLQLKLRGWRSICSAESGWVVNRCW